MNADEILRLAVECQLLTTENRNGIYAGALIRFANRVHAKALAEQPVEQCWKCGDLDPAGHAKCNVPACGMREDTQPAKPVEQGPVALLHDDGYWTAARTDAGRRLSERLLFAGSPSIAVYTAPQPKREPLTDEDIDQVTDTQWASNNHKPIYAAHRAYARAIERAHGIGGQV